MHTPIVEHVTLGAHTLSLEAGAVAGRAGGAVVVRAGDAWLLAAVTAAAEASSGAGDFVPLTVEYRERMSAVGRLPGGRERREARMTDHEVLVSRLIDRTLRPLIPAAWSFETQVFITVFAADAASDLTSLALIGASAALHLSDIPASGPAAGLRLRLEDDGVTLFPPSDGKVRGIWSVSAGEAGILMAEGGGEERPDSALESVFTTALDALAPVWAAIDRLRAHSGRPKRPQPAASHPESPTRAALMAQTREDGRAATDLRPVNAQVGLLPSNHGSALFTRGATQALVSTTLANDESATFETLLGRRTDRLILHYQFPAFAVGEVRERRAPTRREIGHGTLAHRALLPVFPGKDTLPFAARVTSDILASDGSSSMATVCGASLALMDAGVPLRAPVAGVAMGGVASNNIRYLLTDISESEDGSGDFDLKIAGTRAGLTALQLDQRLGGLPLDILLAAIAQARPALDALLDRMAEVLAAPRPDLSPRAPQLRRLRVAKSRVGTLIGPSGKTVQELEAATKTRIEVRSDGRVRIIAQDAAAADEAVQRIEALTADLQVGAVYSAEVVTIKEYGAFVRIGDHEGLVHVSELADGHVARVDEVVRLGETIQVRVVGADARGRLEFSRRGL